ncbi:hypothetical protein LWI28_026708 [Acer negundo]|uniref:Polygalacturonase n=1 Tax=Acer negundo TaxID=4023 RepID=A0AAD5J6Z9_ACENE|nr:hypothetical protein LWI28_026708 [Acer negundo]
MDSLNTDGIHIRYSNNIWIKNLVIGTGDECVLMIKNINITNIRCGPRHGISIRSLAAGFNIEDKVIGVHGNWGVKISDVRFNDIYGTTLTQIAVTLNCIESNPCRKFQMKDINIACHRVGGPAKSYCSYAHGASYGQEYPPSCLI